MGAYTRAFKTCNAVSPALITNTNMFANPTLEHRNLIPVGRFGQPEEVAQVVELLVTNAYMTNKAGFYSFSTSIFCLNC